MANLTPEQFLAVNNLWNALTHVSLIVPITAADKPYFGVIQDWCRYNLDHPLPGEREAAQQDNNGANPT